MLLLLTRYIPNVAKRSTWDQCKYLYWWPTNNWPATDDPPTLIWKILNRDISAMRHPIHFTFGSRVGFRRTAVNIRDQRIVFFRSNRIFESNRPYI